MSSSGSFPVFKMKKFTVITSDMLKQEDRATLLSALTEFRSGSQARKTALSKGFTTDTLDPHGRVVVVKWRGVEIALLFKRAVMEIEIAPVEPVPSVHIADQEQAWTMFNLLGIRYDQELASLKQRAIDAESVVQQVQSLLTNVQREAEQKGGVLSNLEDEITRLTTELEEYKDAEKKSKTLPDGRQLLVKIRYKTRTKFIKLPVPVKKKAVKKAVAKKPAKAVKPTAKKPTAKKPTAKKAAKKKGKKP